MILGGGGWQVGGEAGEGGGGGGLPGISLHKQTAACTGIDTERDGVAHVCASICSQLSQRWFSEMSPTLPERCVPLFTLHTLLAELSHSDRGPRLVTSALSEGRYLWGMGILLSIFILAVMTAPLAPGKRPSVVGDLGVMPALFSQPWQPGIPGNGWEASTAQEHKLKTRHPGVCSRGPAGGLPVEFTRLTCVTELPVTLSVHLQCEQTARHSLRGAQVSATGADGLRTQQPGRGSRCGTSHLELHLPGVQSLGFIFHPVS